MPFHRLLRDSQPMGDLLVRAALRHEHENHSLPVRELDAGSHLRIVYLYAPYVPARQELPDRDVVPSFGSYCLEKPAGTRSGQDPRPSHPATKASPDVASKAAMYERHVTDGEKGPPRVV